MSTSTTVNFPANAAAGSITAEVVAKMNKENGTPFAVILSTGNSLAKGASFTLEIDETTIAKVAKKELDYPGLSDLPVGAKIYFNEDGTFKTATFPTPVAAKKAEVKSSTRTSGSYERPAPKMFDR